MSNFNVDLAIKHVKTITENTECVTCDKLNGPCARYTCGHWICKHCAEKSGECLICIYPTVSSYSEDKPQTQRITNAFQLISTFQEVFKVDVHQRQRISGQLKLEKEIFPDCIQAPCKYSNKRKSLGIVRSKENIIETVFPGEELSYTNQPKMSNSFHYVRNWLNQQDNVQQNIPRKPFADININNQSLIQKTNDNLANHKIVKDAISNPKSSTFRVRSHIKTVNKTDSSLNKYNLRIKAKKTNLKTNKRDEKCDRNESGIVMDYIGDDNELIPIEDTEMDTIDKDKLAWMAVIAADQNDPYVSESDISQCTLKHKTKCDKQITVVVSDDLPNIKETHIKPTFSKLVPFYKKSVLFETCNQCRHFIDSEIETKTYKEDKNNVSIIIDNASFITTIKFNHSVPCNGKTLNKNSIAIQTHTNELHEINTIEDIHTNLKRKLPFDQEVLPPKLFNKDIQNQKIFSEKTTEEAENYNNAPIPNICNDARKPIKCVIIEESDSDSNESFNHAQEIVVDVHKSSECGNVDSGILKTLSQYDYQPKSKRPKRGLTPNSTDSSDKENLDPNRIKKPRFGKKKKIKRDCLKEKK